MSVAIDMDKVTAETVQQLGAQLALLTLELNATRAALTATEAKLAEVTLDEVTSDAAPEKVPTD